MSNSSNRTNAPETKEATDRFRMGVADEVDIPLTSSYNDNLTPAQNGSAGGYVARKMIGTQEHQTAGK